MEARAIGSIVRLLSDLNEEVGVLVQSIGQHRMPLLSEPSIKDAVAADAAAFVFA